MQLIIWRHFRFEAPEGWEVLRFERDPGVGRLTLADRYQHRLEFGWRALSKAPDLDRAISDSRKAFEADDEIEGVAGARGAGWDGLSATVEGQVQTRFMRYFAEEKCLMELTFLWPETREHDLERAVLLSVAEEPKDEQGLRRWKAFGLDLLTDDRLPLAQGNVEPARARLVFEEPESPGRSETFERLGLVDQWLTTPVDAWMATRLPKFISRRATTVETIAEHEVHSLTARWHANLGLRLLGIGRPYEAHAWRCPVHNRLYVVTLIGDRRTDLPRAVGQRLACCDDLLEATC
jgi:hypothetical protein